MKLDRDEALERLRLLEGGDPESGHAEADRILLAVIDDEEITAAFDAIGKWYA